VTSPPSLIHVLQSRVKEMPQGLAFTYLIDGEDAEESLTYAELDRRARAVAALLQDHVPDGARAVLLYPPGLDYIAAFLGCLYAGVVAVPAYPPDVSRMARTLPRLQAIIEDAGAMVVLTTTPIMALRDALTSMAPVAARTLSTLVWLTTDALPAAAEDRWRPAKVGRDHLAFLQYTSGSTGSPRGVMLTHGNLLENERMIRDVFALSRESVAVGWLPLYHDMGLIGNVLQPLYVGFRMVLMSPLDFLARPLRWLRAITRFRATSSGGPNFGYELCARKVKAPDRETLDLRSWKLAFSGAEPVRAETIERFSQAFSGCGFDKSAFLPCYGLAEASLLVTGKRVGQPPTMVYVNRRRLEEGHAEVQPWPEGGQRLVSSGRAAEGTQVKIVDSVARTICPEGRIGEIWVAGAHVAVGYWNDPAKTGHTFAGQLAPSPEAEAPAQTSWLRTGDLGFMLDDELYVSGRLKDLIIIRGRNYYPQDIERVVEDSFPAVRRGCCAAFPIFDEDEERLVVAVEVERRMGDRRSEAMTTIPESDRRAASDRRTLPPPSFANPEVGTLAPVPFEPPKIYAAIRAAIAETFGLHVHAIGLLKVGTIPKTSSGKIQRHACAKAFLEGTLELVANEVPTTPGVEERKLRLEDLRGLSKEDRLHGLTRFLKAEIARVLRAPMDDVDVNVPLSGVGLDSLMAVELSHSVERDIGVMLPMTAFLRDDTIGALAAKVSTMLPEERPSAAAPLFDPAEQLQFPLSAGQEGLWFLHQLAPENSAYNVGVAFLVRSEVLAPALEESLRTLLRRHPVLTTTYVAGASRPLQRIAPELVDSFTLALEDASRLSDADLTAKVGEANARAFDLENGPMLRATLFSRSQDDHVLALSVHHIAADLWSVITLLNELRVIYPAMRAGRGALRGLPDRVQYHHFVEWQLDYLAAHAEKDWAEWHRRLDGVPALVLPTDRPRPPLQSYRGAAVPVQVPMELVANAMELARAERTTLFTALLACFQVLLARYSGQDTFVVGSPVAGRPKARFDRVVGYFVNVLPLCADLRGDLSVRDHLQRVRETTLAGLELQNFPFSRMIERAHSAQDRSRSPLFQVMFVLEKSYLEQDAEVAKLVLNLAEPGTQLGGLELEPFPVEGRAAQFDLTLSFAQSGDVVSGELIYNADLFDSRTAERMANHYVTLLQAIVASPDAAVATLPMLTAAEQNELERWNATSSDYRRDRGIHELFEEHAARTPSAPAIITDRATICYAELNARADGWAARLQDLGVRPEDHVALFVHHSVDAVAAMLGVLKCRAAYLPIDVEAPDERLAYVLEDSRASVVITESALRSRLPAGAVALTVDDAAPAAVRQSSVRAPHLPQSAAYVIYTSGSTGRPKGVVVCHESLVNYVALWKDVFGAGPGDRIQQFASLGFDMSVADVFGPLTCGAAIVCRADGLLADVDSFLAWCNVRGVTILHLPTAYWHVLTAALASGQKLPPGIRLVLIGGERAERDAVNTWHTVASGVRLINGYGPTEATICVTVAALDSAPSGEVPIGTPIANTKTYVLDRHGNLVPAGVVGELYLGGDCLARGYLGRPELTAEKFLPNPFGRGRVYRTGDRVKRDAIGLLTYVGRADDQIKLRGYRIELGEIEAQTAEHPGVSQAVAMVREDAPGHKRLVAYVVCRGSKAPGDAELRAHLERRLPAYMIPNAFVMVDALPLTSNGKVDHASLPAAPPVLAGPDYVAPRNEFEAALCAIASELLGVPCVGIHDNFFHLGGHSLLATQFVSRIRSKCSVEVSLKVLFQYPTIAGLSACYFENTDEGEI
jgi:amino acid adenylation domain-containing protein